MRLPFIPPFSGNSKAKCCLPLIKHSSSVWSGHCRHVPKMAMWIINTKHPPKKDGVICLTERKWHFIILGSKSRLNCSYRRSSRHPGPFGGCWCLCVSWAQRGVCFINLPMMSAHDVFQTETRNFSRSTFNGQEDEVFTVCIALRGPSNLDEPAQKIWLRNDLPSQTIGRDKRGWVHLRQWSVKWGTAEEAVLRRWCGSSVSARPNCLSDYFHLKKSA